MSGLDFYIVSGRVQGVGYRLFVKRAGESLGLSGVVMNLPTGEVLVGVIGGGSRERDLFSRALARGSIISRVLGVARIGLAGVPVEVFSMIPVEISGFSILVMGD